jgi:hypothetical protein
MNKSVALLGLPRSGTNFLRTILEWNFYCEVKQDAFGWKHGFNPIVVQSSEIKKSTLDFVFITRNPFFAISSLFSYYNKDGKILIASKSFKDFIRNRIILFDSEQINSPQYRFKNPIELWNDINWNFASGNGNENKQIHVKYENLIRYFDETVNNLSAILQLTSKTKKLIIPKTRVKNMPGTQATDQTFYITNKPFDQTYFNNSQFMFDFDSDDIEFIMNNIDLELIEKLEYTYEMNTLIQFHRENNS